MSAEQRSTWMNHRVFLVFDFFAGIGGLSRALELAGQKVDHLVVMEKDPECRRLNRTRWPGCDVIADITRVTKGEIEKYMRSVPGLTGVIAGGGSPCQGLSKLNVDRTPGPSCATSKDLAREMRVWSVLMIENVVGDGEDIRQMSQQLGCRPVHVCSGVLIVGSSTKTILEQCGFGWTVPAISSTIMSAMMR